MKQPPSTATDKVSTDNYTISIKQSSITVLPDQYVKITPYVDESDHTLNVSNLVSDYFRLMSDNEKPIQEDPTSKTKETLLSEGSQIENELLKFDDALLETLQKAGLAPEQVKVIQNLAYERILPILHEIGRHFEALHQIDQLIQHFGGEEQWRQISSQLQRWSSQKLPPKICAALSTSADGIMTMYKMMCGSEPRIFSAAKPNQSSLSDSTLRDLMKDPRYWRDQDPLIVEKVRNGFKNLYGH